MLAPTRLGRDRAGMASTMETAYLMRSPANARRLLDAMERLEAGHGEAHDLTDVD